ncbi:MAG: DNA polymerase IV [Alphaproteobacteria bacterium]
MKTAFGQFLCRTCLSQYCDTKDYPLICPNCGSTRVKVHPELHDLSIAHIDCDAFYASVEKRDNPALRDRPVIVGGGRRGVVSAACYVSRLYGVRSAMPMFKALQACPDAVVIRPNMQKYSAVGREIKALMLDVTPAVEPLSIDEAFLDLTGTERLHGGSPATTLARLVLRIQSEIGVTASIGLSFNKFLAKIASDLDKPRGFAIIGQAEALNFLADKPVGLIWGVGKALRKKLLQDGIETIGQIRQQEEAWLIAQYGAMGRRLYNFSRGLDVRQVDPGDATKSISSETTFDTDISDKATLMKKLWPLCETVARRLKAQNYAARTVTLKLKTKDFKTLSRNRTLASPTQLAETLYRTGSAVLEKEADGRKFRLLGIGGADLVDPGNADPPDLADPDAAKRANVERAIDKVRAKLGDTAVRKGRGL